LKNQAIYKAHLQYGYILKDIVEYIGVSLKQSLKQGTGFF